MPPLLLPARELLASHLNVDVGALSWGPEPRNDGLHRDSDPYSAAEVFIMQGAVIIVGLVTRLGRSRLRELPDGSIEEFIDQPEFSSIEIGFFGSTLAEVEPVLGPISEAAKATLNVTLEDYYFRNSGFESIRREIVAEDLPAGEAEIEAARALADRASRTLAVSIKSSRGLLVKDLGKTVDAKEAPGLVERLVSSGIALREVVVVCGVTQTQVARVPDKKSLQKLASDGLRCACGRPIDKESPEDLVTITDIGALLLDKSRWLSVLIRDELVDLGVPLTDILLECQLGSDEIDCIALVSGEIIVLELKDKEFSMGNAYSFSAKISVVNPDHSIILTTEKVAPDVKSHFSRAKRDPRGIRRSALTGERRESIYYVEGENFAPSLRSIVVTIYRSDARTALDRALRSAVPDASSLLNAMAPTSVDDGMPEAADDVVAADDEL